MINTGRQVLVLEDEPFVAIDVEDILSKSDFESIVIISSCPDADKWLLGNKPDIAILDIKLRDRNCEVAAQSLVAAGVPSVVYSGLSMKSIDETSALLKGVWISKSSTPEKLRSVISDLLPPA